MAPAGARTSKPFRRSAGASPRVGCWKRSLTCCLRSSIRPPRPPHCSRRGSPGMVLSISQFDGRATTADNTTTTTTKKKLQHQNVESVRGKNKPVSHNHVCLLRPTGACGRQILDLAKECKRHTLVSLYEGFPYVRAITSTPQQKRTHTAS